MKKETNDFDKLKSFVREIKFTMFCTVDEDGSIHSRPMATTSLSAYNFQEEGTLWFFSKRSSFKNLNISYDQHVNLAYADPAKQRYISVQGRAHISQDKEKMRKLWTPTFKAWFPEGIDDPEISLIGVHVESAEIWDSPPSKVVQLVGFMKAAVSGRPYVQETHSEHLSLKH